MESSAYQDLIDRLNRIEQYVERTTHLLQDIDDELEMSTKDLIETLNVHLATEAEILEHAPVDLLGIDGGSALLHGKEVFEGHLLCFEELFGGGVAPILQGGAKALYALLDVACKDLVESEASRIVELLEEVLHEVLQQPVLVVELEEATLIGGLGGDRLELALFVDGEFAYLGCILDLCAVL